MSESKGEASDGEVSHSRIEFKRESIVEKDKRLRVVNVGRAPVFTVTKRRDI